MTTYINREVFYSAQKGLVIAEEGGARGKVLVVLKMSDGRTLKVNVKSVEFCDENVWREATCMVDLKALSRHSYAPQMYR